jgi:hypothetical protein
VAGNPRQPVTVIGLGCFGESPAPDGELLARQSALQAEARMVLAELDLAALVAGIGPLLLAGDDFSPQDVMRLAQRIVGQAGITSLEYRDERGALRDRPGSR